MPSSTASMTNCAELWPAGIVTVEVSIVAWAVLLLVRLTVNPPLGAGTDKVTMPVAAALPSLSEIVDRTEVDRYRLRHVDVRHTERWPCPACTRPAEAVMVTLRRDVSTMPSFTPLTVKVFEEVPPAIVTVDGTVAEVVSLLDR